MTMHSKFEVLFPAYCVHQYCAPVSAHLDGTVPESISDASRNVPYEDPWADLQQPSGEVAS
ncbi:hypothetical protein BFS79_08245 [Cutibacterium avidum]|uniref:Uncharacterized protein n=1 Tax=Cutibacterium granulosum DSM 20700 TaxID=1160719 RepID=A0A9X5LR80_9ACTN|nr:hypothetical protein BFS79_08245 [Cutibacterium avidum]